MFCIFAGMASFTSNSKLCNFIISKNFIQMPQNFVKDSFSIKSTEFEIYRVNYRVEISVSGPL